MLSHTKDFACGNLNLYVVFVFYVIIFYFITIIVIYCVIVLKILIFVCSYQAIFKVLMNS